MDRVDTKEIGKTAGLVWSYLDKNGRSSLNALYRNLRVSKRLVDAAIGWLAREGKLSFSHEQRGTYVEIYESK
ncbi:MAG TPA: winged helix-turn-helix domain-containing protein [Synergistaceae bacterium]|nr:winged helix-turn-helix domain-containing protein [Synergistaceae bacterium]